MTSAGVIFGGAATSIVRVRNDGAGETLKPFMVSLFAHGHLVGETEVESLASGATVNVLITWTADKTPTGEYKLAAVADSEYRLAMENRDGVHYATELAVADGIAITLKADAALTQNSGNRAEVTVVSSSWAIFVGGDADVSLTLRNSGGEVVAGPFTAAYAPSTNTYNISFDLTGVPLGEGYTLLANVSFGGLTASASNEVSILPPLSITVSRDAEVYETGDIVRVTGLVTGAEAGTEVAIQVVGDMVWTFKTATEADGTYSADIKLPARAGGGLAITSEVRRGSAMKYDSAPIYVKGAYFSLTDKLGLTEGFSADIEGYIENIGYTDLNALTLSAEIRHADGGGGGGGGGGGAGALPTVRFRSNGNAFVLNSVSVANLKRWDILDETMSDYSMLPFALRVDADNAAAGDYTLTLTITATSGTPGTPAPYTKTHTITITVAEAEGGWSLTPLNGFEVYEGEIVSLRQTVTPATRFSASLRVVNIGTADLTGLTVTTPENLPWITAIISGGDVIHQNKKGY